MVQKLAVLSGYPRSGKSTIAKFMEEEFRFRRLSMDNLRHKMYGMSFPEMVTYFGGGDFQSPEYQREEAPPKLVRVRNNNTEDFSRAQEMLRRL